MIRQLPPELLRRLPGPTVLLENDRIGWANDAFAELVGGRSGELEGCRLEDLVDEADRSALRQALERPSGRVRLHIGGEGRVVDLDVSLSADGRRWGAGREVTGVERADALIRQLSALYLGQEGRAMMDRETFLGVSRPLFASLGWVVSVWAIRPDGAVLEEILAPDRPDDAAIQLIRGLKGQLVPYERIRVVGECARTGRGSFGGDAPERAAEVHGGNGGGEDRDRVVEIMRRQGYVRRVCAPVVVGERQRYVVLGVGPDLMERDIAAIQLFATQLAATEMLGELSADMVRQQRLAALGQLSMLVAHEVRNPLAVIFQACRQLRRSTGGGEQRSALLDILDEEAERLKRVVDDLVHFAGPTQPRIQKVDLSEVAHWSLLGLRGQDGGREPHLEVRIPEEASLVQADPLLLRQALTHLLGHAFEHAGPNGEVAVEAGRQDGMVRLRVSNDGPPLPPEVAQRVFEPFFDTKAAGSGLGLAVVRRLVEEQQGRVELEDRSDHCAFAMYLPAADPNL